MIEKRIRYCCDLCGVYGRMVKTVKQGWAYYSKNGWGVESGKHCCEKCYPATATYARDKQRSQAQADKMKAILNKLDELQRKAKGVHEEQAQPKIQIPHPREAPAKDPDRDWLEMQRLLMGEVYRHPYDPREIIVPKFDPIEYTGWAVIGSEKTPADRISERKLHEAKAKKEFIKKDKRLWKW